MILWLIQAELIQFSRTFDHRHYEIFFFAGFRGTRCSEGTELSSWLSPNLICITNGIHLVWNFKHLHFMPLNKLIVSLPLPFCFDLSLLTWLLDCPLLHLSFSSSLIYCPIFHFPCHSLSPCPIPFLISRPFPDPFTIFCRCHPSFTIPLRHTPAP